jgi:guanylate kinase
VRSAESIKEELRQLQDVYVPQGATAEHIRDISIGMIIGATCVGKSTIIKKVTEIDHEFSNPGGFTTRQLRPTDAKTYRHLDDSPESLANFLERVRRGEPVQYNIYDTGHTYGSETQDYPTPFSVLDTQYSAVKNLERAGFKSTKPIAVVVNPRQYRRQLRTRFPEKSKDRTTRLKEGVLSLEWCLEHGDNIAWVINRHDDPESAAFQVIGLTRGYRRQEAGARLVGEKLLSKMKLLDA